MDESLSRCSFYDIGLLVGGISHLPTNALILLMETLRVEEENERNRGGAQIGLEKDVGGLRGSANSIWRFCSQFGTYAYVSSDMFPSPSIGT